jgi:hypothetical protein
LKNVIFILPIVIFLAVTYALGGEVQILFKGWFWFLNILAVILCLIGYFISPTGLKVSIVWIFYSTVPLLFVILWFHSWGNSGYYSWYMMLWDAVIPTLLISSQSVWIIVVKLYERYVT